MRFKSVSTVCRVIMVTAGPLGLMLFQSSDLVTGLSALALMVIAAICGVASIWADAILRRKVYKRLSRKFRMPCLTGRNPIGPMDKEDQIFGFQPWGAKPDIWPDSANFSGHFPLFTETYNRCIGPAIWKADEQGVIWFLFDLQEVGFSTSSVFSSHQYSAIIARGPWNLPVSNIAVGVRRDEEIEFAGLVPAMENDLQAHPTFRVASTDPAKVAAILSPEVLEALNSPRLRLQFHGPFVMLVRTRYSRGEQIEQDKRAMDVLVAAISSENITEPIPFEYNETHDSRRSRRTSKRRT